MRETGPWVEVEGNVYRVRRYGAKNTELWLDEGLPAVSSRLVTHTGNLPGRTWVRIPSRAVTRRWKVHATALWNGERVTIEWLSDAARSGDEAGEVRVSTYNQPFAEAHGWGGSHYDGGWRAKVTLGELSDVQVSEREAPAGGRLSNEG